MDVPEGRLVLCVPSATRHTFALVTSASEKMAEPHCGQEVASEAFGPTAPFSLSDSQSSLTSFYTGAVRALPRGELGMWAWSG